MALQGHHLRVAIGFFMPWSNIQHKEDGSLSVSGVAIDVFRTIASKLNFTYTFIENNTWGRKLSNGTWTGMIGMLDREEVDMAIGPFSITYERSPVVDFSLDLYVDDYGIFLPRPLMEKDLSSFLKPFSWQVWTALAISMIISMITGMFMENLLVNISQNLATTFQPAWIMRALANEPANKIPTTETGRLFLATWLLSALIVDSAYSCVLISLLTIPTVSVPVDSVDDLITYGKIPWAIEKGSALHHLFASAKDGDYKVIHDGAQLVVSAFEERERIKIERIAVFAAEFGMKKIINDDFAQTGKCNYYIAKNPLKSSSMAYAFPKGSWITQHFNRWMGPMKEYGMISSKISSLTSNATACMVAPGKETGNVATPFSLNDTAGIFLLGATGMVFGFVLLIGEILVHFLSVSTSTTFF